MRSFTFPSARRLALAGAAAASLLPAAARAQDTLATFGVDTVVATTRRYPALRAEIPQKIDVVGERDLRRASADELADVLKEQVSADVVQYPGLLSGIGLRGFRPEFSWINQRTLILIDGRPAGVTNLSTIDLHQVERIEVLRGPASSLYGSSAMGGAVNLITRRSRGALRGSARASYGSWETLELDARAGGSLSRRIDADVGVSRFSRGRDYRVGEGNLFRGLVGSETAGKLFADSVHAVPELGDGLRRPNTEYGYTSGSARLGVQLTGAVRADVRGELFRADDVEGPADLYSAFPDPGTRKDLGRRTGEVALSGAFGRHAPLLRAYAGVEETEFFDTYAESPFINYTSDVRSSGLQLQDALRLGAHALTAGFDYTYLEATSRAFSAPATPSAPFGPDASSASAAVFAETKLSLLGPRLTATLGGRYDRVSLALEETPLRPDLVSEEETFTTFNPSVGLQYALTPELRVHGTAGRAFVTPDALFKAGLGLSTGGDGAASITLGNPGLDAESSVTYDLGVGFGSRRLGLDADVTYFHTDVEGRISQVTAAFPAGGRPRTAEGETVGSVTTWVNASGAEMAGVEWRLGYDLGARAGYRYSLRLFANATHLLTRDEEVPAVSVDAARFAGRTDFRPEEVADALVFGDFGTREIRNVADRTITGGVEYDDFRRFSARLSGRYVGARTDLDFTDFANITDIRYPAFMTVDFVTSVKVARGSEVSLLVDNLTDENYYEKRGFNLPGRSVRVRFSTEF
ncbi:MAG TPA: TonB-dependent receptor [Longimicrobium sp.]|nr:TonB-dependent receptor [Longimicrobium sp.]